MKYFMFLLLLVFPLLASELTLKEGFVAAHTEMVMDSTIDPLNTGLKADVTIEDDKIESLKGTFSVDMNLFSSDNADRDEHMDESTEALKFPLAKYTVQEILKSDGNNSYKIKGMLNFHGQDKELIFTAEIIQDAKTLSIKGTSNILVSDYGIEMPCMVFMCVRDKVDLFVKAVLIKN